MKFHIFCAFIVALAIVQMTYARECDDWFAVPCDQECIKEDLFPVCDQWGPFPDQHKCECKDRRDFTTTPASPLYTPECDEPLKEKDEMCREFCGSVNAICAVNDDRRPFSTDRNCACRHSIGSGAPFSGL